MGLAASQATLLQITSRIHDVEFEAQQIQYAKMRLALREDEVQQKYLDALDEQTLTMATSNGTRIQATFDNLCGLSSINNNLSTNGQYIFYDADDRLIVPNDVYNGYISYGGNDPYEFAMYMMVGEDKFREAMSTTNADGTQKEQSDYEKALEGAGAENSWSNFIKDFESELDALYEMSETKQFYETNKKDDGTDFTDNDKAEAKANWINQLKTILSYNFDTSYGINSLQNLLPDDVQDVNSDKFKQFKEKIENIQKEYKNKCEYNTYLKNSGAEKIYEAITKDDDFDQNKFKYYLHWGQLIEREGGLDVDSDGKACGLLGCTNASSFGANIENNPNLLHEMIMYGKISIDIAYFSSSGVKSTPTSATTDSVLSFQNKSTVDSTALKKAEAEYNSELKKINQIDKRYDMSLNRLETERNALTKQYDSVKKVAEDNIERTFGIFS